MDGWVDGWMGIVRERERGVETEKERDRERERARERGGETEPNEPQRNKRDW